MRVLMVSIGGLLAAFGSGCLTLGAVYWAAVGLDLLPTLLIGGVLPLAGGIALIRRARRNR